MTFPPPSSSESWFVHLVVRNTMYVGSRQYSRKKSIYFTTGAVKYFSSKIRAPASVCSQGSRKLWKGQEVKGAQESGTYKECAYGKPDIRYWIEGSLSLLPTIQPHFKSLKTTAASSLTPTSLPPFYVVRKLLEISNDFYFFFLFFFVYILIIVKLMTVNFYASVTKIYLFWTIIKINLCVHNLYINLEILFSSYWRGTVYFYLIV